MYETLKSHNYKAPYLSHSPSISANKVPTTLVCTCSCRTLRTGASASISSKNIIDGFILFAWKTPRKLNFRALFPKVDYMEAQRSISTCRGFMSVRIKFEVHSWEKTKCRQSKETLPNLDARLTRRIMGLKRNHLRLVTHAFNKHLFNIGITDSSIKSMH